MGSTALAVAVAALLKQGHINVQETQESGCLLQCPRNTRQCVSTSMTVGRTSLSLALDNMVVARQILPIFNLSYLPCSVQFVNKN